MPEPSARLKSAIIGCGRIGVADSARLAHIAHSSMLPVSHAECMIAAGLEVKGFCDAAIQKARDACSAYRVGLPYDDAAIMLKELQPDIVSLATRTDGRSDLVRLLAQQGVRGIYAEKPFSRSLAECDAALDAITASGARLVLGTTRRYTRLYRRAREVADELGSLREVRIELAPGSPLMWTVPHSIDLLIALSRCASVDQVQAICHVTHREGHLVDCDPVVETAAIRFNNGVTGTLQTGAEFKVILICEHGEVLALEKRPLLRITRAGKTIEELIDDTMSGGTRAFVELGDAIARDAAMPISHKEVWLNQALLSAIAWSGMMGGGVVRLDEVPASLTITGRTGNLYA